MRVGGHPKVQKTFARVMGYVEQTDIHSPNVSTPFSCSTFPSLFLAISTGLFICCTSGQFACLQIGSSQSSDDGANATSLSQP